MANKQTARKASSTSPIEWKGKQAFYISGTEHDDDSLRIVAEAGTTNKEILLSLVLPTLCITYADMKFANDIGGVQEEYPDSHVYGSRYFDPPVILNGEEEIRKFTWIRGANRVEIGPKETIISWWSYRILVIPRLRIRSKEKVGAILSVPDVMVTVSEPFIAKIGQYADGRHVGGVQLIKRHPSWKPEPESMKYDLWIRVIDGSSRCAIPKVRVNHFTWDAAIHRGGGFVKDASWYTNEMGIVNVSGLPCSDKVLVTIDGEPWLTRTWRFRPLSGQKVRRTFRLWQGKQTSYSYEWRVQDSLNQIAALSGLRQTAILRMNHVRSASEIKPGKTIEIPCHEAIYRAEARDTFERVSEYFCYGNERELASVNFSTEPYDVFQYQGLLLPGWNFFFAGDDDLFEKFDEQFRLPRGWSRPAQRTLHDDPTRAYQHEVVAVPTQEFVYKNKLRRLY